MQNVKPSNSSENGRILTSISELRFQDLLPENCTLELNSEARILSTLDTHTPRIIAQQQFTKNEWTILMLLLESYPYYASYEMLLASLTSLSFECCHQRLEETQQLSTKAVKRELKPVHRALSGVRAKLYKICPSLKVSLVRSAGYALTASSK